MTRSGARRRYGLLFAAVLVVVATLAVGEPALAVSSGFIENRGQVDDAVLYYATGPRASFYVTREALVVDLREDGEEPGLVGADRADDLDAAWPPEPGPRRGAAVWMRFDGANVGSAVDAGERLDGNLNFFLGPDPAGWRTDVPRFGEVTYRDLWPGIDLVFRQDDERVTFEIVADPGADPTLCRFVYEGAESVTVTEDGTELVETSAGTFGVERRGQDLATGSFVWREDDASGATRDDPLSLLLGTFLGGGALDGAEALALDDDDCFYVAGWTSSADFPTTPGAYDTTFGGVYDAFVAKLNPAGTSLVYATYLGAGGQEAANGLAVDDLGNAYVVGYASAGFPTTPGAYSIDFAGIYDVFVTKLDPTGSSLVYSTYVGGNASDVAFAVAIGDAGEAYVTGETNSASFPKTDGAFDESYNGFYDGFITKLDALGSALVYSTFLGGSHQDRGGKDIEIDATGAAYVTGETRSVNFPATPGAYQPALAGASDAYAAKLDPTGSVLDFCTYLGGTELDGGQDLALDASGNVCVAGFAGSPDFPVTSGAYDESQNGDLDAFFTRLDATGSALVYGTFVGGAARDYAYGLDLAGSTAYLTGETESTDFPTTPWGYDTGHNGDADVFLTAIDPGASTLSYSSYLGGSGAERGAAVRIDITGHAALAGVTESADFPTTSGAFAEIHSGGEDAFVVRMSAQLPEAPFIDATTGPLGYSGASYGLAWGDYDGDGDLDIYVANADGPNILCRNDAGVYADATTGPLGDAGVGLGVAWADHDNDGDLDLYLSNDGGNKLFRNEGAGTFSDVTSGPLGDTDMGRSCSWADYDQDGDVDLYLGTASGSNKLLRNDGGGLFADVSAAPIDLTGANPGHAWGDYDDDGDVDLYVSRGAANYLFRNDGAGAFTDVTTPPLDDTGSGHGVDWGDYDNDSDLDLYIGNYLGGNVLLRNDGGGSFADVTTPVLAGVGGTQGIAWGDYDNDGDLDIYCSVVGPNRLLRNDGGGSFTDVSSPPLNDAGDGRGVAMGDYDDDGDLDIYLVASDGPNRLLENRAAVGNHWLHVDLVGTISNESGIGSRVRVVAGALTQIREVRAGSGLYSEGSLTAEFGLGGATLVDSIVVEWPSGIVQVITNQPVDEKRLLVEPGPPANIVCVPDPEYLTLVEPTKTIAVDYLGGGSGLLYAYSFTLTWDGSIVHTSADSVAEGSLLSDIGSTFFSADRTGPNELTIDCALLGLQPGVAGPGTLFTVDFSALATGTSDVDITLIEARNADNVHLTDFLEDDGLLIVDASPPVVTDVVIENLTLAHTDDFIKDGDTARVTATVTEDDPAFDAANIEADLTELGGGALVNPDSYNPLTGEAIWTSTLLSVTCTPSDGTVTVTVSATDPMGNPAVAAADTIIADNTPPTAVLDFDAAPGHEKCDLSWTLGTDLYLAGVVVQRAANDTEYPDYPLFVASWPFVIVYYPADETFGTRVYDGFGTSETDSVIPRNIYYYQAFCYDEARNFGPANYTARDLATNYWLGDVADQLGFWGSDPGHDFNGLVNDADIDKLGGTYYVLDPLWPHNQCDVGPTVYPDNHRLGLPHPDDFVEFEDLMIFATNYGAVAPRVVPSLDEEPSKVLSLSLAERLAEDGDIAIALRLEGNADEVKGISAEIDFDPSELEFTGARLADGMLSPLARVFFWYGEDAGRALIDVAVLGTDVTLGGSGDVAILSFRALTDEYSLDFASVRLRGAGNEALAGEYAGIEAKPEVPTAFRLAQNSPNPFNPVTTIEYHVPNESPMSVRVHDVAGRLVRTLVDGPVEAGRHAVVWDGRNDRGEQVGSGVYFCTMEAADYRSARKMVLLK